MEHLISLDYICFFLIVFIIFSFLEKDRWMQHSSKRQARVILEGGRGLDWIIVDFLHVFSILGLTVIMHVQLLEMQAC